MTKLVFDPSKYYKYDEMVTLLNQWHEQYPNLTKLYSIGKTYEQREMYMLEITNKATGEGDNKPGYYIDGNFHAGEVTGCAVAMYTINHMLNNYGKEQDMTYIIDNFVTYILPRVSCDGAEMYLTMAMMLRSSTRPYPFNDKKPGLHIEDLNGDGYITQMRIKDPNGSWKISTKDERLMIPRKPDDIVGDFYNLYNEGLIEKFDGIEIKQATYYGLDINRNSPVNWKPEFDQKGAGPYPFSEPETRNVGEFILAHKNIAGLMSYHTTSGVHLRPSAQVPDSKMNKQDVKMFNDIGERGKEFSGYPHVNTVEGFVSSAQTGIFMDWAYEVEGILSWSTELWNLLQRAGVEIKSFREYFKNSAKKFSEEDALKVMQWNDKELNGEAFVPWTKFNHSQLGEVEIGGYKMKYFRQNPPCKFLEQECDKNMKFTFVHVKALPLLAISKVESTCVSDNVYKITAVIENKGYQPTSGTGIAQKMTKIATVKAKLELPKAASLAGGKNELDLGHMDGWSKKKAEWVVCAKKGDKIIVCANSDRAGKTTVEIML